MNAEAVRLLLLSSCLMAPVWAPFGGSKPCQISPSSCAILLGGPGLRLMETRLVEFLLAAAACSFLPVGQAPKPSAHSLIRLHSEKKRDEMRWMEHPSSISSLHCAMDYCSIMVCIWANIAPYTSCIMLYNCTILCIIVHNNEYS